MSPPRLFDVDRAKGLAILLVVVGHIVARTPPADNDWYLLVKDAIYQFHMPFFMFLSGLVMGHTFRVPKSLPDYRTFVGKRFMRLFPAYVMFGLLILVGKLLAQDLRYIDNAPTDLVSGVIAILTRPTVSSASSLWYIYVLFAYYLLVPALLMITGGRLWPFLAGAIAFHFYPATDLFMLDGILEYSIYFSLGFLAARHYARYATALDVHRRLFIGVFGLTLAEFLIGIVMWPEARNATLMGVPVLAISKLCLGCSAILALHSLVRSPLLARSRALLTIGLYTFAIYLMNTIAIGVVKGSLLRVWSWDGLNFLAFAPILVLAGILIPITVKRIVLSRLLVLDRMTG